MAPRTIAVLLLMTFIASAALAALLHLGLPLLVSIDGPLPLWTLLAPLAAWLSSTLLLLWRQRWLKQRSAVALLTPLPGQLLHLFLLTALLVAGLGLLLPPPPAPLVPLALGTLALTLGVAMALRTSIQAPVVAELQRLAAHLPTTSPAPRKWRLAPFGALAIRPAVMISTIGLCAIAITLIGLHVHSRARLEAEALSRAHLADLLQVAQAQATQLPPHRRRDFFASHPTSSQSSILLLDEAGQTLVPVPGIPVGTPIAATGGRCRTGEKSLPCLVGEPLGGHRLAVLLGETATAPRPLVELTADILLLGVSLLTLAGLLSWAVSRDISRDFKLLAGNLAVMSQQDEPVLDQPLRVTSIDEVGDLTAAMGRLRHHLERELETYRENLRLAEEADRMKNMFFSDVSHELRTPLTSITGCSQFLLEGNGDLQPRQLEDVRIILRSSHQLLGLINDILDLSIIESGHLELNVAAIDVAQLCREVLEGQLAVARGKRDRAGREIALSLELGEDLPPLTADPVRLQQVLQNLLSNALKFTEEGWVKLRVAAEPPDRLRIEVADSGPGLSATEAGEIFERYRQVGAMKSRKGGTGLGLGICKNLVELHGGTISVESEVGRGSTFTVILPRSAPPREPRQSRS